jgi:hypothetical protein
MIADYGKHSCALNEPVMCRECVEKLNDQLRYARTALLLLDKSGQLSQKWRGIVKDAIHFSAPSDRK